MFKIVPDDPLPGPIPVPSPSCDAGTAPPRGPERRTAAELERETARRIVLRLREGEALARSALARLGVVEVGGVPALNVHFLQARSAGERDEALAALRADPRVLYAEADYALAPMAEDAGMASPGELPQAGAPDDPCFPDQWALEKINAQHAWQESVGASVLVAVIDNGFDQEHPDLQGRFDGNSDETLDLTGHGTHVAGILGASVNNGVGIAGIAPEAPLLAIRAGFTSVLGANIMDAVDRGAKYPYAEGCGVQPPFFLVDAVEYAQEHGVLLVASAGNEYGGAMVHPASIPGVMAVSATTPADTLANFSSRGSNVSVAAPGWQILSTVPTGPCPLCEASGYRSLDGTSMASPYVAGLAALVWDANPALTADQVRAIIERTAVDLGPAGRDDSFGHGRIDAAAAVAAATTAFASTVYLPFTTR